MNHKYKIDIWILISVLVLMIFSIGVVYSASASFALDKFQDSRYLFKQHLIKVVFSVAALFILAKVDYKILERFAKPMIILSILLLIYTVFLGSSPIKGASRWISIGPVNFQPSEIARYSLIIYLALLLARKKDYMNLLYKGYLPVLFYIITVTGLVLIQPNLSVAIIIFSTSMLMIFLSQAKLKHIGFTFASLVPIVTIFIMSKDYIIARLTSYSEYKSSGSTSYQLQQALIGFGNGGLTGVGPGNSNQREFFLPEAHGDFIYSIIGEEYGFIGTFAILCLYFILIYRGYMVAKETADEFGKFLAFGITTLITINALVNMSVASGVIPTTGVTLPFVSYGGTSIIFSAMAVGVLLNISAQRENAGESLSMA
ncbi:MAG: putative lipid II flippase FtsW [Ignavibacteria bacterium]|nr:putative lipid II flippase FtsW [Ignavibacteria bacterium]